MKKQLKPKQKQAKTQLPRKNNFTDYLFKKTPAHHVTGVFLRPKHTTAPREPRVKYENPIFDR